MNAMKPNRKPSTRKTKTKVSPLTLARAAHLELEASVKAHADPEVGGNYDSALRVQRAQQAQQKALANTRGKFTVIEGTKP